jgi:hypothetical protein
MSIETVATEQARRELEEVVDRLINGIRDPEAMRKSRLRLDRMREELRQRIGTVEVAVDLIRDARSRVTVGS